MKNGLLSSSALATIVALGTPGAAHAAGQTGTDMCFGIAPAGANDCANLSGTHACAGLSTQAMGAAEWIYVAKGTCAKLGGKSLDEAKAALKK